MLSTDETALNREEILSLVAKIARERIEPRATEIDRTHEFPKDIAQALGAAGILTLTVPEEYGGAGASILDVALVARELAKVDVSCTMIFTLQCACIEVIKHLGSAEQKRSLFSRLVDGQMFSLGLTEPDSGSDAQSIQTRAKGVQGGYEITGNKRYITNAAFAGAIIVIAKADDGISAFVVDNPSKGLGFIRNEQKMGLHGTSTNELELDRIFVPENARLGSGRAGFVALMRSLEGGRVAIAASAVGLSQRCISESVAQLLSRKQFGKLIGDFQGLRFLLADMEIKTSAANALVLEAAEAALRNDPQFRSISAKAKCFATDVAMSVSTDAVQLFGGSGYMQGMVVERMMRDAKILQIFEGTNQIMRNLVARELLGPERQP